MSYLDLHILVLIFVVISITYELLKSDKRFENYPKCAKNGLSKEVTNGTREAPHFTPERAQNKF